MPVVCIEEVCRVTGAKGDKNPGMQEKAVEFVKQGARLYRKATS